MYALNALYANNATYGFSSVDFEIQEKMSSYWANFAKTLNPNSGGSFTGNGTLPYWPANSPEGTQTVFELGNSFNDVSIADSSRVELVMDYFRQQLPY